MGRFLRRTEYIGEHKCERPEMPQGKGTIWQCDCGRVWELAWCHGTPGRWLYDWVEIRSKRRIRKLEAEVCDADWEAKREVKATASPR